MGKREERKRSEVAGAQREANLAGMNGEEANLANLVLEDSLFLIILCGYI